MLIKLSTTTARQFIRHRLVLQADWNLNAVWQAITCRPQEVKYLSKVKNNNAGFETTNENSGGNIRYGVNTPEVAYFDSPKDLSDSMLQRTKSERPSSSTKEAQLPATNHTTLAGFFFCFTVNYIICPLWKRRRCFRHSCRLSRVTHASATF